MILRPLLACGIVLGLFVSPELLPAQTVPDAIAPVASIPVPSLSRDAAGVVTITGQAPDQVACYSLDGTEPNAKAGPYLAPIDLSHGGKLKARILSKDRKEQGMVAAAEYEPLAGLQPLASSLVSLTQDRSWPGYDWAKRHAEICAAVARQHPQIIFIGDSITHFFGGPVWKETYEPLNAVNMGFGWDRTENVLWRLQHGELEGASPKVTVVMIGTNNLEKNKDEEISSGVQAVCGEIHRRSLPLTKILLLGIFPRGEKPGGSRDRISHINQSLAALNGRENLTFLDFGDKFLNPDGTISKDIMGDFLHPTQAGYQIWAAAMAPALKALLRQPAK